MTRETEKRPSASYGMAMDSAGIYEIRNLLNGKRYIGSAVKLRQRRRQHFGALAIGRHTNRKLQSSWNKHGADAFVFRPLLLCAKADLLFYEQRCLDALRPEYNLSPTAASNRGFKFSPESLAKLPGRRRGAITDETRAKWALALRERTITAATRAKLSANAKGNAHRLGQKRTAEELAKASASLRGRKLSPEHRAKLSAAHLGVKLRAEHRAALSAGHLNSEKAAAQRARLAISNRGLARSEEHKARMRGRRHTEESKAKMSASRRAVLERKRRAATSPGDGGAHVG